MRLIGPGDSSSVIEEAPSQKALALGDALEANILTFIGPITAGVDDHVRDAVESIDKGARLKRVAIVLETEGGFIEVVERIVGTIRHHWPEHVDFIIPNFAMSAGTVLALSGNRIFMDYYSVLGPIDPQVERNGRLVPALGYLHQYEHLIDKARYGVLTAAEASILLEKFDQAELYQFERQRDLSVSLLTDWLASYKFRNWTITEERREAVTDELRRSRAKEIADHLNDTKRWHSHGRGIGASVLRRELKLQIDDFGTDTELSTKIAQYYALVSDFRRKHGMIGLVQVPGLTIPVLGAKP
jgi:hypothetical protein